MKLLFKGAQIIDPANGVNMVGDLLVENGKIKAVDKEINLDKAEIIDLTGKILCPGFIDMHVHLREPGFEYKEDITTGSRAAAAGGFTTICCMPNTSPVIDNGAVASFVRDRGKRTGLVNVLPIGSITKKQAGNELSPVAEMVTAGCIAISDDGKPVMRGDIMRNALEYAKMFDLPVLAHCEDLNLSRDGQMHEGYYSTIYGLKGIPAAAEEVMVARDIILAGLTGGRLHICHVSTSGTLELIRQARQEGIRVTCEVTPHHLILTDQAVGSYDADTKVNPPLRSLEHVQALREALQEGLIDAIATDHAPHQFEEKDCEYNLAMSGISGLETAVALIMDCLVIPGYLDIEQMVKAFTCGPAAILGLKQGRLDIGAPADITVIDPEIVKSVDPAQFNSKGKNTPFKGMNLKGWPCLTMVGGRIVARDGQIMG
ncbi:dihydroorotase [Syntrophomonas palmitatica]|uniref:dihydroorotase n=1 Tax=Syntrophomonas palmitatica TaxID=402877 RepID=UPI0006D0CD4A|nr:dihydroorotase [Syntrophomonas palmitatica]